MGKGILVAIIYFLTGLISFFIVKKQYQTYLLNKEYGDVDYREKISIFNIIIISLLFTFVNIFCTSISPQYGSDRLNYEIEFSGSRSTTSIALDLMFWIFRSIGGNIELFFYLTTFICVFLILYAYKISKNTDYRTYILIVFCGMFFNTFTVLKQAYAFSFACLFFTICLEDKTSKGFWKSLILAIISSMFHITGLLLIPLILIIRNNKVNNKFSIYFLLFIGLVLLLFKPIMLSISNLIANILPAYSIKIKNYFGLSNTSSSMTFIKYIPIYYITILGIANQDKLSDKIENYNKYLCISILCSVLVCYSISSYWFSRFGVMFYFPIYIMYNMINSSLNNEFYEKVNNLFVYGLTFIFFAREIVLIFANYGFI